MPQKLLLVFGVLALLAGCGGNTGVVAHKYEGSWNALPDFSQLQPVLQTVVPNVGTHELGTVNYGLVFKGKLKLAESGQYQFALRSDDGARLYLNSNLLIDNDGVHTAQTATSDPVNLSAGNHELRVEYFQLTSEQSLSLSYQLNGGVFQSVTETMLIHDDSHKQADTPDDGTGGGDDGTGGGDDGTGGGDDGTGGGDGGTGDGDDGTGGGDDGTGGGDDGTGDTSLLSSDKSEYADGESVVISYSGGSGSTRDWIGIFRSGTINGNCVSEDTYVAWEYTNGVSGSETFSGLEPGEYQAQLFSDDSYCYISTPISFTVASGGDNGGGDTDNVLSMTKTEFTEGESVTVNYNGGTGSDLDWIGIFPSGALNSSCSSTDAYTTWQYTNGTSGSRTFSGLAAGSYQAQLFSDDSYCHVGSPVSFTIEQGDDGGTGGGDGTGVKVAFIGDTGTGSAFQNVLNLIKREGAELTIVAGDTSYSSSRDDDWDAMVRNTLGSADPALVAAGNHDYGDSNFSDVRAYGEARLRQATSVSCSGSYAEKMTCRYKNLYFVLSAVGSGGSRSDHESYISSSLNNAPSGAWRICTWHKNQTDMQVGGKSNEVGWTAYETCRQKGAIIATGHEHSYSRTHLLSDMSSQTIASTSSTFTVTEGRTFAFVSGLGGIGIRDQERSGDWWASIYTSTQGARYGAMFGTFYDDRAEFYFKNINGQVIDRFTVMKGY